MSFRNLSLSLAVACCLVSPVFAQDAGTPVEIVGHVVLPKAVEPSDELVAKLKVPEGFTIRKYATGLMNARMLAVDPSSGTVYVTRREQGDCLMLKDTDGDNVIDQMTPVAQRPKMHGIAIADGKMYLTTVNDVYVANIKSDGTLDGLQRIIDDLPDGGQHQNRTLAVGPDNMLYISCGSTCNTCEESSPESATMLRASLDGKSRTIYASGLRNTIGFGWHPTTKELWGMDHGIDWLGDNEQEEELNQIVEGKRYGWPFVFANGKMQPDREPSDGTTKEEWKRLSTEPVLLYTPHAAPMQMAFYTGSMFGTEYKNDAFIAMRGSWNRNPPSGYEILRIHFDDKGKPEKIEPFITGWMMKNEDGTFSQMGRLAGCAVAKDGALLVSDDKNGVIYRISRDATASAEK
jgi:glucose/arabinose dehydrogenase